MEFNKGFLWGGGLAAYQCEGAYNEGGKGLSIADVKLAGEEVDLFQTHGSTLLKKLA